ncbi:MAG: TRAP transporter small permease [Rhodospirillales bacterium]|jgi:C4-dicarboxylate transporter DctQ subunit|nr:TRAP transporter small permease [Rhodospirillales bacterium]
MKALDTVLRVFEEKLLIVLFVALPILCFLQVVCRFVLFVPVPWSEEAMRVLFIWATFIGCSLAVRNGAHLAVTAVVNTLPRNVRNLLAVAINIVCCVLSLYFAYYGLDVVMMAVQVGEVMPVTGLPAYFATAAIPIGFAMMSLRFLMMAINRWIARGQAVAPAA